MPTTNDTVRNSNVISGWKSVVFKIDGEFYEGLKGIGYSEKVERKLVHGSRRDGRPLGMTPGKYSVDKVSLEVLVETASIIKQRLAERGNGSAGAVEFTVSAQILQRSGTVIDVTIAGCRITTSDQDFKEGTDELTTKLDCMALYVQEKADGKTVNLWSEEEFG